MFARHLVSPHQARILADRARFMRFSPTRAEEWLLARALRLQDRLRVPSSARHRSVHRDFACTKLRLVVELDGASHDRRAHHDARRDRVLASVGWRVLRIADDDVFADLDAVVTRIRHACV